MQKEKAVERSCEEKRSAEDTKEDVEGKRTPPGERERRRIVFAGSAYHSEESMDWIPSFNDTLDTVSYSF